MRSFSLTNLFPHFDPGVELGNFERGARYNYKRKDEIIHGLSPSVKSVATLLTDMSLDKE